eukprot:1185342-Prorocentrum_minimum.AAC.1
MPRTVDRVLMNCMKGVGWALKGGWRGTGGAHGGSAEHRLVVCMSRHQLPDAVQRSRAHLCPSAPQHSAMQYGRVHEAVTTRHLWVALVEKALCASGSSSNSSSVTRVNLSRPPPGPSGASLDP